MCDLTGSVPLRFGDRETMGVGLEKGDSMTGGVHRKHKRVLRENYMCAQ